MRLPLALATLGFISSLPAPGTNCHPRTASSCRPPCPRPRSAPSWLSLPVSQAAINTRGAWQRADTPKVTGMGGRGSCQLTALPARAGLPPAPPLSSVSLWELLPEPQPLRSLHLCPVGSRETSARGTGGGGRTGENLAPAGCVLGQARSSGATLPVDLQTRAGDMVPGALVPISGRLETKNAQTPQVAQ